MTVSFQNGSFLGGSANAGSLTLSGGVTAASLYNQDYLDKKYSYTDTKESYEIAYSGRDAAIDTQISNIISQLEKGHEDKAMASYNKLISEMQAQGRYANLEGDQLTAIARQMIESKLGGSLEEYIVATSANSFERGFEINWEGDQVTEADLLKTMCDIDDTSNLDGLKKAGGVVSKVAVTGGAVVAGVAIGTAVGGPIGAVVGGLIGGAISLFRK